MPSPTQLDAITQDDLIATGATRWSGDADVIGAFVAEMDFGIAPSISERLHAEVDRGGFGYLPAPLATELRRATALFLQRRTGWAVDPSHIHEMPDVISIFQAVIGNFLRPDSKIIVPTPAYMPFLEVPELMGREILEVEMLAEASDGADESDEPGASGVRYRYDLAALEAAFDAGGELLVLCNPHNPTGRVATRDELLELADLVDRKGGRVFADEIWLPLVLQGEHVPYASLHETAAGHTITAVAASKAFNLPGLKCAQLVTSNEADRERWEAVGHFPMHGAANLGLAATSAAYTLAGDWLEDIIDYLRRNRRELIQLVGRRLPKARLTTMEGTYVAWIDLRAYGIEGSLHDHLLDLARVECTEGTDCGATGAGHVRFIYAMPRPLLIEAIARISRVLEPGLAEG